MTKFEAWLQGELRRVVDRVQPPSPYAAQARYRQRRGSLPAAPKVALVMVAAGLALSASVVASAATGYDEPAAWARAVRQTLERCSVGGQPMLPGCADGLPVVGGDPSAGGHAGQPAGRPGDQARTTPTSRANVPGFQESSQDARPGAVTSPTQPAPAPQLVAPGNTDATDERSQGRGPGGQAGQTRIASSPRMNSPQPSSSPRPSPGS